MFLFFLHLIQFNPILSVLQVFQEPQLPTLPPFAPYLRWEYEQNRRETLGDELLIHRMVAAWWFGILFKNIWMLFEQVEWRKPFFIKHDMTMVKGPTTLRAPNWSYFWVHICILQLCSDHDQTGILPCSVLAQVNFSCSFLIRWQALKRWNALWSSTVL